MPDDKHKISAEEASLFREAVAGTRRLKHDRVLHPRKRPHPVPRQRQLDEQQVLIDSLSDDYDPGEVETGEELLFSRPGLQHKVLKRLRRGEYVVQRELELDLHGKTVDEARTALAGFLRDCRDHHAFCVRIIHGKGYNSRQQKPILKNKVNSWLRQREDVLAFCSAPRNDGGTGALYVLLKRR